MSQVANSLWISCITNSLLWKPPMDTILFHNTLAPTWKVDSSITITWDISATISDIYCKRKIFTHFLVVFEREPMQFDEKLKILVQKKEVPLRTPRPLEVMTIYGGVCLIAVTAWALAAAEVWGNRQPPRPAGMTEQSLMEGNNSRYLGSTKNSGASQSHGNMVKGMCGLREVPAGHLDNVGRKESSPV